MGRKEEDFEVSVKCPLSKDSDKRKIIFATDLPEDSFFCRQVRFLCALSTKFRELRIHRKRTHCRNLNDELADNGGNY